VSQPCGGQASQLVVHQRQQLLGRLWLPLSDRFQDLRHFRHTE
jgi:hypothetical protein